MQGQNIHEFLWRGHPLAEQQTAFSTKNKFSQHYEKDLVVLLNLFIIILIVFFDSLYKIIAEGAFNKNFEPQH